MFPNTRWTELAQATLSGEEAGRAGGAPASSPSEVMSYKSGSWMPLRQNSRDMGWSFERTG